MRPALIREGRKSHRHVETNWLKPKRSPFEFLAGLLRRILMEFLLVGFVEVEENCVFMCFLILFLDPNSCNHAISCSGGRNH